MARKEPANDDICLWADGTTCSYGELEEFLQFMSDDFEIIEGETS